MMPRTCVAPSGRFVCGVHKPTYSVVNLRQGEQVQELGADRDNQPVHNHVNFPPGDIEDSDPEPIFEIPNPFPFRGCTYILKSWADAKATDPTTISIPVPQAYSFTDFVKQWAGGSELSEKRIDDVFRSLPAPLKLAVATTSTDPLDLRRLAELCCEFTYDAETGRPTGLIYKTDENGRLRAIVENETLFDALVNNVMLPDDYKTVMVLRPGVQGASEIVGDWQVQSRDSHVFEYLRRNSYIPWGHYAANMADDAIRYRIDDLSLNDITGMRHLYYQRTYVQMARELGLPATGRTPLTPDSLEALRRQIRGSLLIRDKAAPLKFSCTLWGWNFGFDYSPSGYRMHASHQQIHQQYAMVPELVAIGGTEPEGEPLKAFCCGDMVQEFTAQFRDETGRSFFDAYLKAIRRNTRLDGRRDREQSLIIYEDDRIMLFVPKAQTSQWELQLMTRDPVGNILETDLVTRGSIDKAMLMAMKVLTALGARMVTVIEYAKRFDSDDDEQRLIYVFLPRVPESPGAFSEAQMRWINGHYPEDFAFACRRQLVNFTMGQGCTARESSKELTRL